MQVKETLSRDLVTVSPDTSLQDAAELMRGSDVGILPITANGQLLGVVTDRDIVIKAVALGLDPKNDAIRNAMTNTVVCCYEDDKLEDAAKAMKLKQVRRLVVLSRDRRPVGVLSLGDLVQASIDRVELYGLLRYITSPAGAYAQ